MKMGGCMLRIDTTNASKWKGKKNCWKQNWERKPYLTRGREATVLKRLYIPQQPNNKKNLTLSQKHLARNSNSWRSAPNCFVVHAVFFFVYRHYINIFDAHNQIFLNFSEEKNARGKRNTVEQRKARKDALHVMCFFDTNANNIRPFHSINRSKAKRKKSNPSSNGKKKGE